MKPSQQNNVIVDTVKCEEGHVHKRYRIVEKNTPHQEAWAERFDKRFSKWEAADDYDYSELRDMKDCDFYNPIKDFISQELTSQHKADCERFRGMIETMYKAPNDWKKTIKRRIGRASNIGFAMGKGYISEEIGKKRLSGIADRTISFFSTPVLSEKQDMLEKIYKRVQGMKGKHKGWSGYNEAISDVIRLLDLLK